MTPSIEELLDEYERASSRLPRPGEQPTVEMAKRVVAAREALLSRFLEQQKELEEVWELRAEVSRLRELLVPSGSR